MGEGQIHAGQRHKVQRASNSLSLSLSLSFSAQEALSALERRVADGLARMEFLAARMESVDRNTAAALRMCVVLTQLSE